MESFADSSSEDDDDVISLFEGVQMSPPPQNLSPSKSCGTASDSVSFSESIRKSGKSVQQFEVSGTMNSVPQSSGTTNSALQAESNGKAGNSVPQSESVATPGESLLQFEVVAAPKHIDTQSVNTVVSVESIDAEKISVIRSESERLQTSSQADFSRSGEELPRGPEMEQGQATVSSANSQGSFKSIMELSTHSSSDAVTENMEL